MAGMRENESFHDDLDIEIVNLDTPERSPARVSLATRATQRRRLAAAYYRQCPHSGHLDRFRQLQPGTSGCSRSAIWQAASCDAHIGTRRQSILHPT